MCEGIWGQIPDLSVSGKRTIFPKLYEGLTKDMEQYPSDIKIHLKFGVYEITDCTMEVTGMCDLAVCAMKRGKGVYDRNVVYYDESIEEEPVLGTADYR